MGKDSQGRLVLKRPLKLSARGLRPVAWYIDGEPLGLDESGEFAWLPPVEGFYDLTVIDAAQRVDKSHVRIVAVEAVK
ncbi:penicillin-Binding Protein [Asticcacaulis biprosthecium C19]|uniref:Penicillin-Binding Protein n=2 Tax=Asticcacaulis biprosthecium TaxID=76891 RepID=F4QKL1_9CAUL|nr:penicillin-Binding Protein [Asticcacaulis biprosthecium C19]